MTHAPRLKNRAEYEKWFKQNPFGLLALAEIDDNFKVPENHTTLCMLLADHETQTLESFSMVLSKQDFNDIVTCTSEFVGCADDLAFLIPHSHVVYKESAAEIQFPQFQTGRNRVVLENTIMQLLQHRSQKQQPHKECLMWTVYVRSDDNTIHRFDGFGYFEQDNLVTKLRAVPLDIPEMERRTNRKLKRSTICGMLSTEEQKQNPNIVHIDRVMFDNREYHIAICDKRILDSGYMTLTNIAELCSRHIDKK